MAGRTRLQRIVDQARATFGKSNPSKDPLYKENLEKLKEAVSSMFWPTIFLNLCLSPAFSTTIHVNQFMYFSDERCNR